MCVPSLTITTDLSQASALSDDIKKRMAELFGFRKEWTAEDITPYLVDVATGGLTVDKILFKHARAFTGPSGVFMSFIGSRICWHAKLTPAESGQWQATACTTQDSYPHEYHKITHEYGQVNICTERRCGRVRRTGENVENSSSSFHSGNDLIKIELAITIYVAPVHQVFDLISVH